MFYLLPILFATLFNFILGMLWFSPLLFMKKWKELNHITSEQMSSTQKKEMNAMFAKSFLAGFVMMWAFFSILENYQISTAIEALNTSITIGTILLAATIPNYIYLKKPLALWAINTFYPVVSIIGAALIFTIFI